MLDRVNLGMQSLVRPRPLDPQAEAVRDALRHLGVLEYHRTGQTGKGIKVAVLDSGFRGYRNALGKALPAQVKCRSFRKDGQLEARDSQHGILCGEVIHHLAPGAELIFANWEPETPAAFLDAVRWVRSEGAQIISCSVIMPAWSDGEGGGPIHRELTRALGNALMFASAGNTAQRHWSGPLVAEKDGVHQWVKGRRDCSIRPFSSERVSVELTTCDGAYEVVVHDLARGREVGRSSTGEGTGCRNAVVRFEPTHHGRYVVRVRGLQTAGKFHLTCLGGKLQYATALGSIPFPSDGQEVVAVGAVDVKGRRMSYSSCGPCAAAPKPDLVAPVPFPSVWRAEQPFAGTSAAAPQAAGVAALVWGRHHDWDASRVRTELCRVAVKARAGHCVETGYGSLRAPRF